MALVVGNNLYFASPDREKERRGERAKESAYAQQVLAHSHECVIVISEIGEHTSCNQHKNTAPSQEMQGQSEYQTHQRNVRMQKCRQREIRVGAVINA
jgi:hypothetical protein